MNEQAAMNKHEQLERIVAHARYYHGHRFWILGLGHGYQGGYGSVNSTSAKSLPVYETIDDLFLLRRSGA
jgi:hypothetical protein